MAITKPCDTVYLSLSGNFSSHPCAPRPSPKLEYPLHEVSGSQIRPCFSILVTNIEISDSSGEEISISTALPRMKARRFRTGERNYKETVEAGNKKTRL